MQSNDSVQVMIMHNKTIKGTPIWKKSLLTVVEAAKYFQIGEENIRRITRENKDGSFVLWRNRRVFIRREAFEKFLDGINEI